MLKTLDVLIGFSLVMLIMSMAVTVLTQLIGTAILNLRGRALSLGLARLLRMIDDRLTQQDSSAIAAHILSGPLIGPPSMIGEGRRLAGTVHREDLVSLLLRFAATGVAANATDSSATDEQGLRDKLRRSFADNGIGDPEAVLAGIRNTALALETSNPELSHSMRLTMATLSAAASDFLSKLNSCFDQIIDRVSELFTTRTRWVTALISVALALVLHLDAVGLLNRLSVDDALRDRLVAAAIERSEQEREQAAQTAPASTDPVAAIRAAGVADLEGYGLVSFPRTFDEWVGRWRVTEAAPGGLAAGPSHSEWAIFMQAFGILLSAALLSLGAPFWYSALRDMVKLRSIVARRDDDQRAERQSTQAAPVVVIPAATNGGASGGG